MMVSIAAFFSLLIYGVRAEGWPAYNLSILDQRGSWTQGRQLCQARGERLLVLDDVVKKVAVAEILKEFNRIHNNLVAPWLGMVLSTLKEGGSAYLTVDCERQNYTAWGPSEPAKNGERCAVTDKDSAEWRARYCNNIFNIACEKLVDSCWFEVLPNRALPDTKIGAQYSSSQDCQNGCLIYVNETFYQKNQCVAASFSDEKGCAFQVSSALYAIPTALPTTTASNGSVFVKRCYGFSRVTDSYFQPTETDPTPTLPCLGGTVSSTVFSSSFTPSSSSASQSTPFLGESSEHLSESVLSGKLIQVTPTAVSTSWETSASASTVASIKGFQEPTSSIQLADMHSPTPSLPLTHPVISDTAPLFTSLSCPLECSCPCTESVDMWATWTSAVLTLPEVNKKTLSSTRRRLTSAPDGRLSAQVMGWVGIFCIAFVPSLILLADLTRLCPPRFRCP